LLLTIKVFSAKETEVPWQYKKRGTNAWTQFADYTHVQDSKKEWRKWEKN